MSHKQGNPEDNQSEPHYSERRASSGSSMYGPIRDLDPRISCLLRGMNMGVVFGLITGIVTTFFIRTGLLTLPFFRSFEEVQGAEFYVVWIAACLCLSILVCEVFSVLITPWRHLR